MAEYLGKEKQERFVNLFIGKRVKAEVSVFVINKFQEWGVHRVNLVFCRKQQPQIKRAKGPEKLVSEREKFNSWHPASEEPIPKLTPIAPVIFKKCKVDWTPLSNVPPREKKNIEPDFLVSVFKNCNCKINEEHIIWFYQIRYLPKLFLHVAPLYLEESAKEMIEVEYGLTWKQVAKNLNSRFKTAMESNPGKPISIRIVMKGKKETMSQSPIFDNF